MLGHQEISLEERERRGLFTVICFAFMRVLEPNQQLEIFILNETWFKRVAKREPLPEERKAISALESTVVLKFNRDLNMFRRALLIDWNGDDELDGISGAGFFQLLRAAAAKNRGDVSTSYQMEECERYITEFEELLNRAVDKTEKLLNDFLLHKYGTSLEAFTQNPEGLNPAARSEYQAFQKALAIKFIIGLKACAASQVEISRRIDSLDNRLIDFYNQCIEDHSTYANVLRRAEHYRMEEIARYRRLHPIQPALPEDPTSPFTFSRVIQLILIVALLCAVALLTSEPVALVIIPLAVGYWGWNCYDEYKYTIATNARIREEEAVGIA